MPIENKKLAQLVAKLVQQTVGDKVRWEKTASPGVFLVAFPDYGIRLSRQEMPPDTISRKKFGGTATEQQAVRPRKRIVLEIVNTDGDVVEDVGDEDIEKLGDLYDLARGQALEAGKAVDELLAALDGGNT